MPVSPSLFSAEGLSVESEGLNLGHLIAAIGAFSAAAVLFFATGVGVGVGVALQCCKTKRGAPPYQTATRDATDAAEVGEKGPPLLPPSPVEAPLLPPHELPGPSAGGAASSCAHAPTLSEDEEKLQARRGTLKERREELNEAGAGEATKDRPGRVVYTEERKAQAATLIQAHTRGKLARRRLKAGVKVAAMSTLEC